MAKTTLQFNQSYRSLNPAQKEAVDTIEGPVMVIAGPGTGKTQILTLRIANILKRTDTDPESILALTFTDAGAQTMRRRLASIIGSAAYRVTISTFHSFCNDIIRTFPEEFPNIIGSRDITDIDQIKIIKELIDKLPLKNLRPLGSLYYYINDIRSSIDELKKDNIDEKKFRELVKKEGDLLKQKIRETKAERTKKEKNYAKNKELSLIYVKYQETIRKNNWYDYADMIIEVVRALERNKNLKLSLQERYLYLLADEHQDTNHAQNRVLELISDFHQSPNLFIVGDEKQAIFRFQGASLENFFYFKDRFPKAKLINLEINYRSTQTILDASQSVIENAVSFIKRQPLKSAQKKTGLKINLAELSSPEVEEYFLAEDIRQKIKSGVNPSDIVVIYRDNKDAFSIVDYLEKSGLPFVMESSQNILEDQDIKKLLAIFKAVSEFGNDQYLVPVLHIDFLKIEPLATFNLLKERQKDYKKSLYDLTKKKREFREIFRKFSSWSVLAKNERLVKTFEIITNESGYLSYVLASKGALEKMERLGVLFDEAQSFVEKNSGVILSDFIQYLEMLKEHGLAIKKKAFYQTNHIRLMTAHGAKGREFGHVYITGVYYGHWGSRRHRDLFNLPTISGSDNDDERRLFYVALTRAKESVTITYAAVGRDGKERIASQFVKEILPKYLNELDVSECENKALERRKISFNKRQPKGPRADDPDVIKELFLERGLSPTALNNYLKCPWQYFYMNLLRIPRSMEPHQMFGEAVHKALAEFSENIKKTGERKKQTLVRLFKDNLLKKPLGARCDEWLERGQKALEGFYSQYYKQWRANALIETNLSVQFTDSIKLVGKLDKIDFLDNSGGVNVVDYKTGKPKSRNQILGKTKDSQGDIWRQLVFYKILLDGAMKKKYKFKTGEIVFVEPSESGNYKREVFEVSEKDVKELEEIIKKVSDEIMNLKFWNKRCDDKKCEFCALREMMRER